MHYNNYRDALWAAYVLGPPPSRCGDLELEGGVNVSLRKYGLVHGTLINPRRACAARVTVVCVCVCLSVRSISATTSKSKTRK